MQSFDTLLVETGLVVIVRSIADEALLPFAEAMYRGGVRLLELTFPGTDGESLRKTAARIAGLRARFDGRMEIGAGTVFTPAQVERAKEAGGRFVLSPNVDRAVIEKTRELGLVSLPGAMTPSEIANALRWGAQYVKLFPAGTLGAGYVRAIRGPLPDAPLLAVGGIDAESIPLFRQAGVCGFGVGGALTDREAIARGDWETLEVRAASFVKAARI